MSKDYKVGYKKPPVHSRFQKGQSGNRSGRPKGKVKRADLDTVLDEVLSSLIPVNDNGRARKISKFKALVTQTVNKGVKGDHRAANLILSLMSKQLAIVQPGSEGSGQTAEEFEKDFNSLLDEMAKDLPAATATPRNDNSAKEVGETNNPAGDNKDKSPPQDD